jgi:hypothetical protein
MALPALLAPIIGGLFGKVIDAVVADKTAAAEIKVKAVEYLHTQGIAELDAAKSIIVAEAQSGSWLAQNWRPLMMLMFGFVIFNNYILFPYASLLGIDVVPIDLPVNVWDIIQLGIGGYVIGRSAEKVIPQVVDALKGAKGK